MIILLKKIVDKIDKYIEENYKSFSTQKFQPKETAFFNKFKDEYIFEQNFLTTIYDLEKKLQLVFYSSNWPKGFRNESSFFAYRLFNVTNNMYKSFTYYYKIIIEEDIMSKLMHNVYLYFPNLNEKISIINIYEKLNKINKYDKSSINYEIMLLKSLSLTELDYIGNLYFESKKIVLRNSIKPIKNAEINISPFIKLFKSKFNYIKLTEITDVGIYYTEGVILFEPLYCSNMSYNLIEKNTLNFRIYNDINSIYFSYWDYEFSLKEILSYINIDVTNIECEFEHIMRFSTYDLNVIKLILREMIREKFT